MDGVSDVAQIPFEVADSPYWQIGLVILQTSEACSDWDNDFLIIPATLCDVCRSHIFYLCAWIGRPDALSEIG